MMFEAFVSDTCLTFLPFPAQKTFLLLFLYCQRWEHKAELDHYLSQATRQTTCQKRTALFQALENILWLNSGDIIEKKVVVVRWSWNRESKIKI